MIVKYFFLFLCIFICIKTDLTNGQTKPILKQITDLQPHVTNTDDKTCLIPFSAMFLAPVLLDPGDFIFNDTAITFGNATIISNNLLTNQVISFLVKIKSNSSTTQFNLYFEKAGLTSALYPIINITCNYISDFNFRSISNASSIIDQKGYLKYYVEVETLPRGIVYGQFDNFVSCTTPYRVCSIGSVVGNGNLFSLTISNFPVSQNAGGVTMSANIKFYTDQTAHIYSFDNLFRRPYDFISSSLASYPRNNTAATMKTYTQQNNLRKVILIYAAEKVEIAYPTYFNTPYQAFRRIRSYYSTDSNKNIAILMVISDSAPSSGYLVTEATFSKLYLDYVQSPILLPVEPISCTIEPALLTYNVTQTVVDKWDFSFSMQNQYYTIQYKWPSLIYPIFSDNRGAFNYRVSVPRPVDFSGTVTGKLTSSNSYDSFILSNKFIKVSPTTQLLRINITTFYPLVVVYIGEVINPKLISGDRKKGVFEMEVQTKYLQFGYQMVFTDSSGFNSVLYYSQAYNSDFSVLPSELKFDKNETFDLTTIQTINFTNTIMNFNFSYLPINNSVVFSTTQQNPNLIPTIDFGGSYFFNGFYDQSIQLYSINFTIPPLVIYLDLPYTLGLSGFSIQSSDLRTKFGELANLKVSSSTNDTMKPTLINLQAGPAIKLYGYLNWNLSIEDTQNGFLYGTVDIISNKNPKPISITFTNSSLVSGNNFYGVYQINYQYNTSSCCEQTFRLANLRLYDRSNINTYEIPDQLIEIYDSDEYQLEIKATCQTVLIDDTPPFISSFSVQPRSIDVGSLNRNVSFQISVSDGEVSLSTGLSISNTPVIVLSSEYSNPIYIETQLSNNVNKTFAVFSGSVQIPFGYGFDNIFISVYGLVDNNFNINGYVTDDLKQSNFIYNISRYFTTNQPYIQSASNISNSGGSITLYGNSFGLDSKQFQTLIKYGDDGEWQYIQFDFFSGSIIQLNNRIPSLNDIPYFYMQVQVDMTQSNIIKIFPNGSSMILPDITPTPTPTVTQTPPVTSTPKPSDTVCPNNCSNRGQCLESGCVCQKPWTGPSCNSEIIIIPTPTPQPDPSTGINITDSTIFSSIKIGEIRELDDTMNIVKRNNVDSWDFTDLTTKTSNPTYFYTGILPGTTTTINVTIEFFINETDIQFGGQTIKVQKSSIKYTLDISSYSFLMKTNYLQIVMSALIQNSNGDSCSSKQLGSNGDNVAWIKMNIDKTSLYGRFLSFAMVDDRFTNITNNIVDNENSTTNNNTTDTSQFREISVGITIPNYDRNVKIDPDFSNLIDVDGDSTNELCSSKSKKLSNGAIAGIVVGAVVFITLIVGTSMLLYKRKKTRSQNRAIENKLKAMDKN
ncbi:EGF-like domain-containing protein [Heterostelium album PN500]|uniref:EGF-like domain-containing protein n=1 Tax=Heterostelium pallidum (strain ATCC 26659 / Pp 5 / PN500) TaxID=670386 RepID=D3B366_HETP5|nr:EGF-like domain-containing protein [Heterostelium album PN500]EFA83764.1 EGF-like domain-containing protein [Heterostelium album PN500]|eukprot:XP_020435881.1 EGF-like domain-containing protein [Heterostelium album PN500]